jgi:uncharacterized protein YcbK (DUF882 family)
MNRRGMLSVIAGAVVFPGIARAAIAPPSRFRLKLVNAHTGERFDGAYRDGTGPLVGAMTDLSLFLRDFHSTSTITFDIAVIDFLAPVMHAIDAQSAVILSAYRTPDTNSRLARSTFGVADNSQHLYGRALDVHFGARLVDAMRAARAMKRGGVGWYPRSGFLHLDSGPVRNWDLGDGNLGSLLAGSPHRPNKDDRRYTAELNRSGRLKPEIADSGRVRQEMAGAGKLRLETARKSR